MNYRKFLIILSALILSAQISQAQSGSYGNLLWSGTYTFTGSGFEGINAKTFSSPFLIELKIYEKALIYNNEEVFYYTGMKDAYYMRNRYYTSNKQNFGFLVSDQGVPFVYSEITQFLPYVGNVTTTSLIFINAGDTRAAYLNGGSGGGGYSGGIDNNGGNYNNQRQQRSCSHCHGTGWCPTCNNTGWVTNPYVSGQHPCVNCNPNGDKVYNPNRGKCPVCGGSGKR